jgi:hypothetical protein
MIELAVIILGVAVIITNITFIVLLERDMRRQMVRRKSGEWEFRR